MAKVNAHKTHFDRSGPLPYNNRRTGSGPAAPHRYYQSQKKHPEMNESIHDTIAPPRMTGHAIGTNGLHPQSQYVRKEESSHAPFRAEDNNTFPSCFNPIITTGTLLFSLIALAACR